MDITFFNIHINDQTYTERELKKQVRFCLVTPIFDLPKKLASPLHGSNCYLYSFQVTVSYLLHPAMKNVIYLPHGQFDDNADPTRSVHLLYFAWANQMDHQCLKCHIVLKTVLYDHTALFSVLYDRTAHFSVLYDLAALAPSQLCCYIQH